MDASHPPSLRPAPCHDLDTVMQDVRSSVPVLQSRYEAFAAVANPVSGPSRPLEATRPREQCNLPQPLKDDAPSRRVAHSRVSPRATEPASSPTQESVDEPSAGSPVNVVQFMAGAQTALSAQMMPAKPKKQVNRKTKAGRLVADINQTELQAWFQLPEHQACRRMGMGLTVFKRVCRRFGIRRWPYRKLQRLKHVLKKVEAGFGTEANFQAIESILQGLGGSLSPLTWGLVAQDILDACRTLPQQERLLGSIAKGLKAAQESQEQAAAGEEGDEEADGADGDEDVSEGARLTPTNSQHAGLASTGQGIGPAVTVSDAAGANAARHEMLLRLQQQQYQGATFSPVAAAAAAAAVQQLQQHQGAVAALQNPFALAGQAPPFAAVAASTPYGVSATHLLAGAGASNPAEAQAIGQLSFSGPFASLLAAAQAQESANQQALENKSWLSLDLGSAVAPAGCGRAWNEVALRMAHQQHEQRQAANIAVQQMLQKQEGPSGAGGLSAAGASSSRARAWRSASYAAAMHAPVHQEKQAGEASHASALELAPTLSRGLGPGAAPAPPTSAQDHATATLRAWRSASYDVASAHSNAAAAAAAATAALNSGALAVALAASGAGIGHGFPSASALASLAAVAPGGSLWAGRSLESVGGRSSVGDASTVFGSPGACTPLTARSLEPADASTQPWMAAAAASAAPSAGGTGASADVAAEQLTAMLAPKLSLRSGSVLPAEQGERGSGSGAGQLAEALACLQGQTAQGQGAMGQQHGSGREPAPEPPTSLGAAGPGQGGAGPGGSDRQHVQGMDAMQSMVLAGLQKSMSDMQNWLALATNVPGAHPAGAMLLVQQAAGMAAAASGNGGGAGAFPTLPAASMGLGAGAGGGAACSGPLLNLTQAVPMAGAHNLALAALLGGQDLS